MHQRQRRSKHCRRINPKTALIALITLAITSVASAIPISVSGTWRLYSGIDAIALDGTTFNYQVNPGDIVGFRTLGSGAENTVYSAGDRNLVFDGTADGIYREGTVRQNTSLLDAEPIDRLSLGGSAFDLGDYRIEIPLISLNFAGDFIIESGADPLPSFNSSDISTIGIGSIGGVWGLQLWQDTRRIARYSLATPTARLTTVIPEPPLWALLGVGILCVFSFTHSRPSGRGRYVCRDTRIVGITD